MKPATYVETTIVSYLSARPSRDLLVAAHQQVTRDWWAARRVFDLHISQFVLDEAGRGNREVAARRLEALRGLPLLDANEAVVRLARLFVAGGGLPAKAATDALHIAAATVHGMQYLVTWNCAHIANAATRARIEALSREAGFEPPTICTPLELNPESLR